MIKLVNVSLTNAEIAAVVDVLKSGRLVQGPQAAKLEENFAQYCQCQHAIAVNSGTAAVQTALYAAGVKTGDEVITTPFTFVATANAIKMQGAEVVFADIDPTTFNLDPNLIEEKITDKTAAILVVDLYGQPAEYDSLSSICRKHNLKLIADSCQAVAAKYKGKYLGNIADLTAFSLYATKNIMSVEGGLVSTNSDAMAKRCQHFKNHGQKLDARYEYVDIGYNYRLTDVLASLGVQQLAKLEDFTQKRVENARYFHEQFNELTGVSIPRAQKKTRHVYHQYTIRVTPQAKVTRDELAQILKEAGIETNIFYPTPLHHFEHFGCTASSLPEADRAAKEVLSLPVHPALTTAERKKICTVVKDSLK